MSDSLSTKGMLNLIVVYLVWGSTYLFIRMESILERKPPSLLLALSLLVGFSGLAVLVMPVLKQGLHADVSSTAALLAAAMAWSGGSLLLQRRPPESKPILISAYQHLFGGLGLTGVMLLTGEPWPHPIPMAWLGWAYLVIAGSLISFTSYIIAVRTLPISVVMTYAYINPVIAVLLGWLVLGGTHHHIHGSRDGPDPHRGLRCFLETVRTGREMILKGQGKKDLLLFKPVPPEKHLGV